MLDLTVDVHLSDCCVQKFLADGLFYFLIKIHGVHVRSGQILKGVLHFVLYFIVVLVYTPIIFLIVLLILYRTERIVQF